MPIVEVPAQLTVKNPALQSGQLSPAELRAFTQKLAEWQEQNGRQVERSEIPPSPPFEKGGRGDLSGAEVESALLASIFENSRLPAAEQRRFNRLRRKRQAETLTKSEEAELQALWQGVEQMNVVRLEALTKLAQRHGTDVLTLMRELGLKENRDVF
jgi:hypothetical protein